MQVRAFLGGMACYEKGDGHLVMGYHLQK
jgi:hypothetical protein